MLAQPKRLAVLAFLAARPAGEYVRRDTVLGLFWPEASQEAARRSLRQTLFLLRRHLGPGVVRARGDGEIAADPEVLECDVARFLRAAREGRDAEALECYRGDLLTGFYLNGGTAEFERWLEDARARLRRLATACATRLASQCDREGDREAAVAWARRGSEIAPEDEDALRRLLLILESRGEPAAALRAYEVFARRLAQEFDHAPSRQTQEIAARIRAASVRADRTEAPVQVGGAEPTRAAAPAPGPLTRAAPLHRWRLAAMLAGIAVLLAGGSAAMLSGRGERLVLAVGDIRSADPATPSVATRVLPDLLATDLARVGGLTVLSRARLEEVAGHLGTPGRRSATASDVASEAGATDLVEGVLYRVARDSLRLDLRVVDLRSAATHDAVSFTGHDAFTLADSAVGRLARRLGGEGPAAPLAAVTSSSLEAHALYAEGLRAFYRNGDDGMAARVFADAVAADSTFAMAAYYLSRSLTLSDFAASRQALRLAARMATHATPREALMIRAAWGEVRGDPAWPSVAESLAARYPGEPESELIAGRAKLVNGDFAGAVRALREAIRLDALSLRGVAARCLACDAYAGLIDAYLNADSLAAATAVAREWLARQPRSPRAWNMWSVMLERAERPDEALAARATIASLLGHQDAGLDVTRGYLALRRGDVAAAESLLAGPAADRSDPQHAEAVWWLIVTLRYAGRPEAAVGWARRFIREDPTPAANEGALQALPLGQALFEAGHLAEAARVFDAAGIHSRSYARDYPGGAARDRAWSLTQRATVVAAEGDSAALQRLGDSIAVDGQASALGRDRRLASYVHGLLLDREGDRRAAVDSLTAATFSASEGYTRVNLELARMLLAQRRPAAALRWVQAALRGGLEASNYYVTRTELHEAAAQAFAALGRTDSARVHYAYVARAWAHAEPRFLARRDAAREYLGTSTLAAAEYRPRRGGPLQ